ncbi:MAG TPA: hypothetical protein VGM05_20045 [Planctomycetaceae bacterium]|jgi:hypothetical protein
MTSDCKKPGWAFWTTMVVVGLVLYVLSGAPAEILVMKFGPPDWIIYALAAFYKPLVWLLAHGPDLLAQCYQPYGDWWCRILGIPQA